MENEIISSRDYIDKVIEEKFEAFYSKCGITLSTNQKEEAYRMLHARAAFDLISLRNNQVVEPLKIAKIRLARNNCQEAIEQFKIARERLYAFDNGELIDELYKMFKASVDDAKHFFTEYSSRDDD